VLERTGGSMPQVQMPPSRRSNREELKTLLTGLSRTSAGAFIVPDRQPGLIPLALRPLVVRNLVTVGDTNVDIVEWVKENSFTNAAAETAEATATATGGTKPESGSTTPSCSRPSRRSRTGSRRRSARSRTSASCAR
jgi:hypothetical protein